MVKARGSRDGPHKEAAGGSLGGATPNKLLTWAHDTDIATFFQQFLSSAQMGVRLYNHLDYESSTFSSGFEKYKNSIKGKNLPSSIP